MKISIIGAGNVGSALAAGWAKHGHDIVIGVRDPQKKSSEHAKTASVRQAAQSSDIIVLAVPWNGVPDAIKSAGDLTGKIILDATNPLLADLSGLDTPSSSGGEKVAELARVPVVKIFNTTGYGNMVNPDYNGQAATMFYCGDDDHAKKIAAGLAADLGFDAIDAGPLRQARLLEPLALLWITLARNQGLGYNFAFKVLRR